jgi:UDP-N-acetyl-2-amino-2-deoxyglucuronate dehydrogenase
MPRQWRIAVIGTGVVGDIHLRALKNIPECKAVAVCDLEAEHARKALAKNNLELPIYTNLADMLDKEKLDSVHVCTPSGDHSGPAIAAMNRGLNALVEKPIEILPERVDEMIAVSRQRKVRLAGIFQNRWDEANAALHDAAEQNRFGRIAWAGLITPWFRSNEYYASAGWRGTWKLDGGGAVMNQGVHQVDLMQWIVGPVKTVSALASTRVHPAIEVEDVLICNVQFENGAYGTFVATTAMWPGGPVRIEVGGEFGSAVSENGLTRFEFQTPKPEDKELLERLSPAKSSGDSGAKAPTAIGLDMHGKNIQSIYQSWDRNEDATTSGPEARKAVAIIKAMYDSARKNGQPVDVK